MERDDFPAYESHEAAATDPVGCFNCGGQLDGKPLDTGYPPRGGQFRQRCTGRCGMYTYYDLLDADGVKTMREATRLDGFTYDGGDAAPSVPNASNGGGGKRPSSPS